MKALSVVVTGIAVLVLWGTPALGTVIHVPGDYPTIQAGINAALNGDTVLVASYSPVSDSVFGILVEYEHADFPIPSNGCAIEITRVESELTGYIDPSEYDWYSEPGYGAISFWTTAYNGHLLDVWYTYIGTYSERLTISVSILLAGEDPERTVVWGGGEQPIVNATADHVTIRGFMFWGANGWDDVAGIYIDSCEDVIVERNLIGGLNAWGHTIAVRVVSSTDCVVRNNTVYDINSWLDGVGVRCDSSSGTVIKNNIFDRIMCWGGHYAIYNNASSPVVSYNCRHECSYFGVDPGPGDISADPLFVEPGWSFGVANDYGLQELSPCIDTGDPTSPVPFGGGCVVDMGALEFEWPLSVRLVPDTATVARGDTLRLTATIQNTTASSVSLDGWADVTLPNGNPYAGNPVVGPMSFVIASGGEIVKHVSHPVPAVAPLGTYAYAGKVGTYPGVVDAECEFEFDVVASDR